MTKQEALKSVGEKLEQIRKLTGELEKVAKEHDIEVKLEVPGLPYGMVFSPKYGWDGDGWSTSSVGC